MPNHESHGHPGRGWAHHPGGTMGGPFHFFLLNAIVTQFFARIWMVASVFALMRIASSLALGARVRMMSELRDDLSEEQRLALLDDIWRRARRKRMANCPIMPPWCSHEGRAEK